MIPSLRPALAGVLLLACGLSAVAATANSNPPAPLERRGKTEVARVVEEIERARDPKQKGRLFGQLTAYANKDSFEAMTRLCKSLQHPDVMKRAFKACENYKGVAEIEERVIEWMTEQCNASREPLRAAAAQGLALFGEAASPQLSSLVRRSKDAKVRAYALGPLLDELKGEGSPSALETVVDNAELGATCKRQDLVETLEAFTGKANNEVFFGSLRDKKISAPVKATIVDAIGAREADGIDKALLGALKEDSPEVQLAAIAALDQRGEATHAAALKKLIKAKDEGVRRQSVISLGQIRGGEEGWLNNLEGLVKSKDPATRMGAAVALAEVRTPEALELLYSLLYDSDHLVQHETLQQIGNLRRLETVPALIARINGVRGRLRMQLFVTLRLITGVDNGTSTERWKRWWDSEGANFELPTYDEALRLERERDRRRSESKTVSTFFGLQVVSDRICFIMDVSGSMEEQAGSGNRLDMAKKQLSGVLEQYPAGDLFNVIFFSSDAFAWEDELIKMTDKTRKEALKYVGRQTPGGATAIYDALKLAFEDRRIDTIYLLTDGEPSGGTINEPERIRSEVRRWNTSRHVRINCIAVGKPSELLKGLARDTGGDYREE